MVSVSAEESRISSPMARVICCGCCWKLVGSRGGEQGRGEKGREHTSLSILTFALIPSSWTSFWPSSSESTASEYCPLISHKHPLSLFHFTISHPPPKTSSNSPRIRRRRPKPPIHTSTPTPTGPCARPAIITSARIPITRAGAGWRCAGWAVAVAGVVFEKGGAGVALVEGGGGESAGFGGGGSC